MEIIDYGKAIAALRERAAEDASCQTIQELNEKKAAHEKDVAEFNAAFHAHKAELNKAINGGMFHFNTTDGRVRSYDKTFVEFKPGFAMDVQRIVNAMKEKNDKLIDMLYVCLMTTHDDDETCTTWYTTERIVPAATYAFEEAAADPVDPYYANWGAGKNFRYGVKFYYDFRAKK